MRQLAKLTWMEVKLFARDPLTLFFSLAFPAFILFMMAGVFGNTPDPEGVVWAGVGPMDYLVPGICGLAVSAVGFMSLPVHIAGYRERGVLRRLRASSVSPAAMLLSQLCVSALLALIGAAAIIAIGMGLNGADGPVEPAGFAAAFVLTIVCFVALGTLLGAILPNVQAAQAGGLALFFVSEFTSGVGPPREVLPDTMQQIAKGLPLTHITIALQDPWIGRGWNLTEMAIVAGITVVAAVLAHRLFRWE